MAVGSVIKQDIEDGIERECFSYDSNCSHEVNFYKRLADYNPPLITRDDLSKIEYKALIPKFHLAGHKPECSDRYSLNFTEDVGRMSGELVETPWADLNPLQYSLREMGWGNRRDALTDQLNGWNHSKETRMCKSLHRQPVKDTNHTAFLAGHLWDKYYEGVQETKIAEQRLQDLEVNLGPDEIKKLEDDAKNAGGEQYRPKATATLCKHHALA